MLFTWRQYAGSMVLAHRQFVPQPGSCRGPLALDGAARNAQELRGLIDLQTAEESQLDYVGQLRIHRGQSIESLIEREKLEVEPAGDGGGFREIDANESGAALICSSPPRIVHQDAPHKLGGGAKEIFAALPME